MKGNKNTKWRPQQGVDMIISGDVVTIFSTVISIVVPVIFGVVLLVGSVKILERKYSLC